MKVHEYIKLITKAHFKVEVFSEKTDEFNNVDMYRSELMYIDVIDMTLPHNHVKETIKPVRMRRTEVLNEYGDYELFRWYATNIKVQVLEDKAKDHRLSVSKAIPIILIYLPGAWNPEHELDVTLH